MKPPRPVPAYPWATIPVALRATLGDIFSEHRRTFPDDDPLDTAQVRRYLYIFGTFKRGISDSCPWGTWVRGGYRPCLSGFSGREACRHHRHEPPPPWWDEGMPTLVQWGYIKGAA